MINTNKTREQNLSEMFNISPYSSDSEEVKFSKREQEEIDKIKKEILNNLSSDSTDSEDQEIKTAEHSETCPEDKEIKTCPEDKEIKTYYILFMELKKGFNICISKRKHKEYFTCVMCDEDKDLIMEFENHFKYNSDKIKLPGYLKDTNYRIHNLTKDKLKREMDKFIKSLGIGYYLDYFSTVKHWSTKY